MRYSIKLWSDPYNEKGQYKESELHNDNKKEAVRLAENAVHSGQYQRAIVLDTYKTVSLISLSHVSVFRLGGLT